jgi:hypothetical protein
MIQAANLVVARGNRLSSRVMEKRTSKTNKGNPATLTATGILATLVWTMAVAHAGTLSVKIVDEHDAPAPARVYLLDAAGAAHMAADGIVYNKAQPAGSERNFVPPEGRFKIELPAGSYRLIVERGKEFESVEQKIELTADGTIDRTVRCIRWIDMASC